MLDELMIQVAELHARARNDMLSRDTLPTPAHVLGFGAQHNPAVWRKHQEFIGGTVAPRAVVRALEAFEAYESARLTRRHVFHLADEDAAAGAVAAFIWGFPTGGYRGKWQAIAAAIGRADEYARVIDRVRGARSKVTAREALTRLHEVQAGIGWATTSKIAYFARLPLAEGTALIYDQNVVLSIKASSGNDFVRTRNALGASKHFYHRGLPTYGSFIAETTDLSSRLCVDPDRIELGLFQPYANPKSGWGYDAASRV